jgi:preprotein translocase subunit SecG
MSILSKTTMSLVALFMINCLVLASLTKNKSNSISKELNAVIEETNSKKTAQDSQNQNPTNINQSSPAENVAPKPSVPAVE